MTFILWIQWSFKTTVFNGEEGTRYSDEQLYSMALYLYSLEPPPNPNPRDALALKGRENLSAERLPRLPHATSVREQQADTCCGFRSAGQASKNRQYS